MFFVDEHNRPLPGGTALKDPCTLHEGIVAYVGAHQVMLHKPLSSGRPVMTAPAEFSDGKCKVVRTRTPRSTVEGAAIVQRAWAEVQSGGTPWTIFDNCEDFVSRSYAGQSGSATRNFFVGLLAVGVFSAFALGALRA